MSDLFNEVLTSQDQPNFYGSSVADLLHCDLPSQSATAVRTRVISCENTMRHITSRSAPFRFTPSEATLWVAITVCRDPAFASTVLALNDGVVPGFPEFKEKVAKLNEAIIELRSTLAGPAQQSGATPSYKRFFEEVN